LHQLFRNLTNFPRITALPDGLTNYQLKQWSEKFYELKEKMLTFGFMEDVRENKQKKNMKIYYNFFYLIQLGSKDNLSSFGLHYIALRHRVSET